MKMVKSLLLGSAAGLVAVTTGQAADLPVKAKPVEYVKVCSLYGAGFYYMPGTDMCIKIGGWVRAEAGWGYNGNLTWGPFSGNANVRTTSNLTYRARGYITADAREQTAYGTARGYIAVGLSTTDVGLNTAANQFSANRAFVQWAGFTGGITQSFYDFYSVPAVAYNGTMPASDTGDPGWAVFGYTAQLGNGLTASVAAEERRTTQILNVDGNLFNTNFTNPVGVGGTVPGTTTGFYGVTNAAAIGTIGSVAPGCYQAGNNMSNNGVNSVDCGIFPGAGAYGGWQAPDIVANLRLDQTWGGAQVMVAAHELNANGYDISKSPATPGVVTASGFNTTAGAIAQSVGHPGDTWGWAVGGGLRLNFPMIAQGDYFQGQVNYTEGALRYIFFTPNTNWGYSKNSQEAFGVMSDAVFGSISGSAVTGTGLNLTTAYGFNASYEHYWTPSVHQSFVGAWDAVKYNTVANNQLCALVNNPATFAAAPGMQTGATGLIATPGCNMNWSTWTVGSRLQWDITKSFYMGVEAFYSELDSGAINSLGVFSASSGASGIQGLAIVGSTTAAGVNGSVANEGNWIFRFRAHKDFLP